MILSGIDFKLSRINIISCTALFVVLLISWNPSFVQAQRLVLGAEQFYKYEDLIKNKKVGVVVNQTSRVEEDHLVDFLVEKGILRKYFHLSMDSGERLMQENILKIRRMRKQAFR